MELQILKDNLLNVKLTGLAKLRNSAHIVHIVHMVVLHCSALWHEKDSVEVACYKNLSKGDGLSVKCSHVNPCLKVSKYAR